MGFRPPPVGPPQDGFPKTGPGAPAQGNSALPPTSGMGLATAAPCQPPAPEWPLQPGIQGPVQDPASGISMSQAHAARCIHTKHTHIPHTHMHTHAYTRTHTLMGRSTLFSLRFPLLPTKSVPSKFHLHDLIHTPNPDVWLLPHYPPQYSQQCPKGPQLPVPVPLPQPAELPDLPSPQVTAPPSCITSCCCLSSPPFSSLSHLTYIDVSVSLYKCSQWGPSCLEESQSPWPVSCPLLLHSAPATCAALLLCPAHPPPVLAGPDPSALGSAPGTSSESLPRLLCAGAPPYAVTHPD